MSSTDKSKLDGIDMSNIVNVVHIEDYSTSGAVMPTSSKTMYTYESYPAIIRYTSTEMCVISPHINSDTGRPYGMVVFTKNGSSWEFSAKHSQWSYVPSAYKAYFGYAD
uniref:Uncharacterized protein n=1 Tax=Dulem virus 42 TaxID=3145760 RepID=A0AAU8B7K6_9CAUD